MVDADERVTKNGNVGVVVVPVPGLEQRRDRHGQWFVHGGRIYKHRRGTPEDTRLALHADFFRVLKKNCKSSFCVRNDHTGQPLHSPDTCRHPSTEHSLSPTTYALDLHQVHVPPSKCHGAQNDAYTLSEAEMDSSRRFVGLSDRPLCPLYRPLV